MSGNFLLVVMLPCASRVALPGVVDVDVDVARSCMPVAHRVGHARTAASSTRPANLSQLFQPMACASPLSGTLWSAGRGSGAGGRAAAGVLRLKRACDWAAPRKLRGQLDAIPVCGAVIHDLSLLHCPLGPAPTKVQRAGAIGAFGNGRFASSLDQFSGDDVTVLLQVEERLADIAVAGRHSEDPEAREVRQSSGRGLCQQSGNASAEDDEKKCEAGSSGKLTHVFTSIGSHTRQD